METNFTAPAFSLTNPHLPFLDSVIMCPAGMHKAVRLTNLPRDSVVRIDLRCDGPVTVLFISEEQYRSYPGIS